MHGATTICYSEPKDAEAAHTDQQGTLQSCRGPDAHPHIPLSEISQSPFSLPLRQASVQGKRTEPLCPQQLSNVITPRFALYKDDGERHLLPTAFSLP